MMIISTTCPTGTSTRFVRDLDPDEKHIQQGGNKLKEFEELAWDVSISEKGPALQPFIDPCGLGISSAGACLPLSVVCKRSSFIRSFQKHTS
jgi:hypothetical protein